MQLNPQQLSHVLSVWPVARLATIGPTDAPHLVPIVFAWVDGLIVSPVDGKPKRSGELQRIRNVARDAAVSLLLDHYDADWGMLWWLRIDGIAEVATGDGVPTLELKRVVDALKVKYRQYQSVAVFAGTPTLLRVHPQRHNAWSAQPIDWEALR